MRVRVLDAETEQELNVRHIDELMEHEGWTEAEAVRVETEIRTVGRYWTTVGTRRVLLMKVV